MQEESPENTDEKKTEEVPRRRQRRSASQLTSFSSCGEAYRLERIARAPRRPAAWFFHGTAVHAAIEQYEESRREATLDELEDTFIITYREEANKAIEEQGGSLDAFMTGGRKKPETDLSDREELGWYQVQDYVRLAELEQDAWAVIATEIEFEVEIGGIAVTGFIDQVVQNVHTWAVFSRDIKTGQNMPPTPVQLAIYSLALQDMAAKDAEGKLPWTAEMVLPAYAEWLKGGRPASASGKTKAKPTEIIPVDLTSWGHDRVAAWLQEMDRAEKAEIYLPNPGDSCHRICPVSQFCSVMGEHMPSVEKYARPSLPIVSAT